LDGASPVMGPEEQDVPLSVLANDHFANEYAPGAFGCHRALRLPVTG
jgi:hypothetical protein